MPDEKTTLAIKLKLSNNAYGHERESFALYDVEDALISAIGARGVVDGHQIGRGYFSIFIITSDVDAVIMICRDRIQGFSINVGSFIEVFRPWGGSRDLPLTVPLMKS